MVGRDAETDEAPRRGEALDQVDLDARFLAREQRGGRVEGGWPGAHDRNASGRTSGACYGWPGVATDVRPCCAMSKALLGRIAATAGVVSSSRCWRS